MAGVVAAIVLCCSASGARAADGDLFVDGCLAQAVAAPCSAAMPSMPIGLAISPDGKQLYAGVGTGPVVGLQVFDITPETGAVAPRPGDAGCYVAAAGAAGCTKLAALNGLDVAYDVAASPDGRNVYMATLRGAVINFARSPETGDLAFVNCVGNGTGCTALAAGQNVNSVAVSPDSRNVYIRGENGLAVLDRDESSHAITQKPGFDGCFNEGSPAGCTDVDGLAGEGWKIVVSPDGNQVYTAFGVPGGITTFSRASDGRLTYVQGTCISSDTASGASPGRCRLGDAALATTFVVAVSPDGRAMYAGGQGGLTAYSRDANGALSRTGCFGAASGCTPVPAGLTGVIDLAVTPHADELVATSIGGTVVAFTMGDNGSLTERAGARGCLSATGSAGQCSALPLVASSWMRLAMDPNHLRFYLASSLGMLATITRDYAPVCDSFGVSTAMNTALSIPLRCSDVNGDPFTIEKVTAPAAGQVGEIVNGSVFYNPFGSYAGSDAFTYRAVTPSRGVTGAVATVNVDVVAPASPPPNPNGLDNDRDGFTAGQDCNDANAAIRPGAVEVKGNNLDENCDGFAEPFPTLGSGVVSKWNVKSTRVTLTTLQVTQQFPKGWKAKIYCKGKRCPFKSKTLKAGKVKKGASTIISSLSKKQRLFRAGQTIEIWVSAPRFNTKVARFVLKKGKIPTTQPYCVLPGQTKVQKSCT